MKKEYQLLLNEIADYVHDHPESGFYEYESSKKQVEFLREQGFQVEENVANTRTGYIASYGSGRPVIALLGEFDALYGLGQEVDVTEEKSDGREMGHGCGHHLLGTGCIGAGLLVKDYLEENHKEGTILVMGCPAEEAGSGKAYMARDGVFDDVDVALAWHPSLFNMVATGSSQSCISAYFRFYGVASHAAGSPEKGRSALDAVELMDIGTNYMREHMKDSDRVHYAITNSGGKSPNVVQAFAEVNYFVRSTNNHDCLDLYQRVCDIAKGAALMTQTRVEVFFDEGLSNTIPNFALEDVLQKELFQEDFSNYSEEDLAYAQAFKDTYPMQPSAADLPFAIKDKLALAKDMKESPMNLFAIDTYHSDHCEMGSTDVGDVSWVIPTSTLNTACYSYGADAHSWQWVAQGKSAIAHKGMEHAANILARSCIALYEDPSLVEKAKEEFAQRMDGDTYPCLIPQEVQPHSPKDK